MIVRLMGEGQYRLDDALGARLNALDNEAVDLLEAGQEAAFRAKLEELAALVRRGERLPDDDLAASDVIVPPSDLSLEEARSLFAEDGLIPDLPA